MMENRQNNFQSEPNRCLDNFYICVKNCIFDFITCMKNIQWTRSLNSTTTTSSVNQASTLQTTIASILKTTILQTTASITQTSMINNQTTSNYISNSGNYILECLLPFGLGLTVGILISLLIYSLYMMLSQKKMIRIERANRTLQERLAQESIIRARRLEQEERTAIARINRDLACILDRNSIALNEISELAAERPETLQAPEVPEAPEGSAFIQRVFRTMWLVPELIGRSWVESR